MLGVFAGIAFLLAGIGIHGLLSFAVSHRAPEIGVRMAMGAQRRDILGMVLTEGLTLAIIGVIAGVALAYAAGRSMEALLAGITPWDLPTFATGITRLARHDNRRQPDARTSGGQSRSVGGDEGGVVRGCRPREEPHSPPTPVSPCERGTYILRTSQGRHSSCELASLRTPARLGLGSPAETGWTENSLTKTRVAARPRTSPAR